MSHPDQLTDGTGTVWVIRNAATNDRLSALCNTRNGQPLYYSTGADSWSLTRDEIKARYGLKD